MYSAIAELIEFKTIVNWITMISKSGEHLRMTYGNTGQIFRLLLDFINSVYSDLRRCRSRQHPQIAKTKFYKWATVHIALKWRQIN